MKKLNRKDCEPLRKQCEAPGLMVIQFSDDGVAHFTGAWANKEVRKELEDCAHKIGALLQGIYSASDPLFGGKL